jgi:DNA-directed RNA polymerase subunit beta'
MGFHNNCEENRARGSHLKCYKICGHDNTVAMLDKLKELGFREATKAGFPSELMT